MESFEFVSHESFPQDPYIAEAVVLCLEGKYRITYIRKKMKNGGMFWDIPTAAVKVHGENKYLKSFSQNSNFLAEDIKHFLESRAWEKTKESVKNDKVVDFPF